MSTNIRTTLFHSALRTQGIDFRRHLATAIEHQSLDTEALVQLQISKLKRVLHSMAGRNRVYRQLLYDHGCIGLGGQLTPSLVGLPAIGKDQLAQIAMATPRGDSMLPPVVKRTSGSSGSPLALRKDRRGLAQELAATWRSYGWYGVAAGDRQVRVWGRPLTWRKRVFKTLRGVALNSVEVSAFDVSEATLRSRMDKVCAARPRLIYGYTSALRELACYSIAEGLAPPKSLLAVVTTAEPLDPGARETIESAFSVKCRNEYGCSEVGSIAHECLAGNLHLMADNLIAEVLREDGSITTKGFGELLITDLTNERTPVIRYRVGDYCELRDDIQCSCGVTFPVIDNVLGRVEDTIVVPGGFRHHPALACYMVDKIDASFGVVEKYQVVQCRPDKFEIRLVTSRAVPLAAFQSRAEQVFSATLMHPIEIKVTEVQSIPREPSGKYRIVVGMGR